MSNVETTNTGMPAAARGVTSDAMTPVVSKGIGPASANARQPGSTRPIDGGRSSSAQTTDSSAGVRVIEKNSASA